MNGSSALWRRQHGAIAVLTGILLVVLIGMAGLVLDLAHLYIVKTELQNTADACALSAARELSTIDANTITRATSAGIVAGQRNRVNFQSAAPDIRDADITFGPNLDANAEGGLLNFSRNVDSNTQYVRCAPHEAQRISVAMWFMGVLGIGEKSVAADAVAKYPKAEPFCAIPLAMCIPEGSALAIGKWYTGHLDQHENISGNFAWLQLTPDQHGASDLRDIIAGDGVCDLQNIMVAENKGGKTGVADAWNTRFGVYQGSYRLPKAGVDKDRDGIDDRDEYLQKEHKPDLTGKAYNPADYPNGQVYSNYLRNQTLNTPFDPATFPKENFGEVISKEEYRTAHGGSRRMVSMPVLSCETLSRTPVKPNRWACALMVHPIVGPGEVRLELVGYSGDPDCAGGGAVAGFPKLVR